MAPPTTCAWTGLLLENKMANYESFAIGARELLHLRLIALKVENNTAPVVFSFHVGVSNVHGVA